MHAHSIPIARIGFRPLAALMAATLTLTFGIPQVQAHGEGLTSGSAVLDAATMDQRARTILSAMKETPPAIVSSFNGPAGMRGHILQGRPDEARILVWQTADGHHLLMGNLYDHAGRDLTNLAGDHHNAENPLMLAVRMAIDIDQKVRGAAENAGIPSAGTEAHSDNTPQSRSTDTPDYYKVGVEAVVKEVVQAARSLDTSNGILWPDSAPDTDARHTLSLFIDPFCPYCHKLLDGLEQYDFTASGIRIRLLPVNLLGEASEHAGARALASSEHPTAALNLLHGVFVDGANEPGPEHYVALKQNHDVMVKTTMEGTPTVVFDLNTGTPDASGQAYIGIKASDLPTLLQEAGVTLVMREGKTLPNPATE